MLRNSKCDVLFMFSKPIGIRDSNEAEVYAILEALHCFSRFFHSDFFVWRVIHLMLSHGSLIGRPTLENFNLSSTRFEFYQPPLMLSSSIMSLHQLILWLIMH